MPLNFDCNFFIGSPWSVFDNWHLKEQYKRSVNRIELSQQLSKNILYAGLINLALAPVIFLFAVIFCIFSYGDVCIFYELTFCKLL